MGAAADGSNCCGAASAITVAEGNNVPKTHSNKSAAIRRITVRVQQRQPWCWTGPRRILECLALYQGTTSTARRDRLVVA
jgi:hypothetical protein